LKQAISLRYRAASFRRGPLLALLIA